MRLVEISDLSVRYGRNSALRDVDFHIDPGEIVTLVGPNGSGKSTLLRAVLGAVPVSTGTITRKPGLRVGYVPQKLHIDGTLRCPCAGFWTCPSAFRMPPPKQPWRRRAAKPWASDR